jgi:subtilase family serine protease
VNQNGVQGSYPQGNTGWGEEISLDLDMVSAICPNCRILLVEATTNSFANLGVAVNYAAAHANAVSNSYGAAEFGGETSYAAPYNHPGVAITASSGDGGYGVEVPAAFQSVTAVGGTSLIRSNPPRGWNETVWSGAGSGCSTAIPRPTWQTGSTWTSVASCTNRTVADVAAVADPNTGVAVYDTYVRPRGGWLVFGGTSVASPIIASVYALAGNAPAAASCTQSGVTSTSSGGCYPYLHPGSLYDVTSGSNGSCGGTFLCTGETSYDGPSGLGTPNGIGGF